MIGIYKITNPIGGIYIGQSVDIKRRLDQHRRLDYQTKCSPKLYRSLLKYGWEYHKSEIICECEMHELNEKERYYQEFYDATSDKNLNYILTKTKTKKGVGKPISDRQKEQISKVHKGKKLSKETIDKIKSARSKQIITEEHKRKISENSGAARIVLNIESGIFHNSAKEAAKAYGIKPNTLVCRLIGKTQKKSNLIYV